MDISRSESGEGKANYKPIFTIALISLVLCGVLFPLLLTGVAQVLFPYQANGEIVQLNGHSIGSSLIAENFTLPIFFHSRAPSDSASGVDPDVTLQAADAQVARISDATGIPSTALEAVVHQNIEGVWWVFGSPYVNVQKVNLALITEFPSVYKNFTG
ncbi:MAG: potassium-transporting ATPase subunit C [Thaumarchaeota archaeon]|nr:potassium-transporting ATPase subunit C [Nitrososphaerota archaeon]